MPHADWAAETYPAFASGCGFVLARDLVDGLVQASPQFRYVEMRGCAASRRGPVMTAGAFLK